MSTAAASASTGSGCSLVVSAGNSSQDLRLDLELPAPSVGGIWLFAPRVNGFCHALNLNTSTWHPIDWTSCCSHKRTSEQEEFEKTASLCARFRVQGEAGFGHCVLGIESGSVCRSRSAWIASKVAPVSSLDVPAADQDFGSRCHLALSTKCRLDEVTPASPLDVHDATQDFVAHRRRSHLPLSTICRLDAQPLYHFSTSTTRFKTWEPLAVEATLLFPRYADSTSHLALSTVCRLDESFRLLSTPATRLKTSQPIAIEAILLFPRYADLTRSQRLHHLSTSVTRLKTSQPIAVEATLLFPRYADLTRHLPLSTICRLDAVTAPVSLLDVHDTIQDLGAPPRRSHVAVSTKCRLDQQSLYHFSTSTTRFKTWEPLAVEATLLFPRHTDLTRSQPVRPLSTPVPRFKTSEPITVEPVRPFSTHVPRFKTSEPIAVEATLLFPRYTDLTRLAIIQALSVKLAESLYLTPDNLGPISQDQYHNAGRKACFAARFLPSLISAYKCSLESHSDAARACYSKALTCVMHSPYFVKYLRRKGDTTLLEFHADRFLERWPVPEGICDKPEDHDREYPILFLMDSLDILHFLLHYAAQFPRYLTPLSESKYTQAETWLKVGSIMFDPESEASIVGSKLTAPAELLEYTPWLKCGCFNGDGHQHDGAVGCSAIMPKTRLKKCGRCQATTYCSTEHQILDRPASSTLQYCVIFFYHVSKYFLCAYSVDSKHTTRSPFIRAAEKVYSVSHSPEYENLSNLPYTPRNTMPTKKAGPDPDCNIRVEGGGPKASAAL
ncbi:hypothetical protein B0H11DRAFT_1934004 [Mycena galericulata]|nr:hypothetical protein B0H11DRAFT_1934004 [Mycena galericulata]